MGGFAPKKVDKLTDDQRKLIEENHNLIYKIIYDSKLDMEEWYDILAIVLCNAAMLYDPNRDIKFSTYACRSMKNEICKQIELSKAQHRIPADIICSYDRTVYDDNEKKEYVERLTDNRSFEDDILDIERFKKGLLKLKPRDQQVILMLIDGYTYAKIGEKFGISRERVRQITIAYANAIGYKRTRRHVYHKSVGVA